jgi:hypothetical protein
MAESKIGQIVLVLLSFTLIIAWGSSAIGTINNAYENTSYDPNFNGSLSGVDSIIDSSESLQGHVENAEVSVGGFLTFILSSFGTSVGLIFNSILIIPVIIMDILGVSGLGTFGTTLGSIIIAGIILTAVFLIFKAVTQREWI